MDTVSFTQMKDGTKEDYLLLKSFELEYAKSSYRAILMALEGLKEGLLGYKITRYEHSLQTATRAYRDNASDDMIIGCLLHDIGDIHAPFNHAQAAGAIIKPFVSEKVYWIVSHHDIFQKYYFVHHYGGDRDERLGYQDHPFYQDTIDFCENWDQASFDPSYKSHSLDFFLPIFDGLFTESVKLESGALKNS